MPSLYTQYRPKNFSQLVGQSNIVTLLKSELLEDKTAQSYIFIGPRGTGKTTTARILAKALNCEHLTKEGCPCDECASCKAFNAGKFLDLIEIDAASNRGIDEIREMKEKIEFKPTQGKRKVYIIDEVHMLTKEAFNALLKTLEEPPIHITFILATTEPHKIPLTILSRCEKFEFRLGGEQEITKVLNKVLKDNSITIDETALKRLIQFSGGSYRDALSLLDTIITSSGKEKKITFDKVQTALGLPDDVIVSDYINALASGDSTKALATLEEVFSTGVHISQFIKIVITEMREFLVTSTIVIPGLKLFSRQQLVKAISYLLEAYTSQKQAFDQRLPMQIATINIISLLQEIEPFQQVVIEKAQVKETPSVPLESEDKNQNAQPIRETTVESASMVSVTPTDLPKKKLKKKKKKVAVVPQQEAPVVATEEKNEGPLREISLEEVLAGWQRFLKQVQPQNTQLYAMLVTSAPQSLVRDEILNTYKLELGVKYDFHKKRIESPGSKELLNTICKTIFGSVLQIICTVNKEIVLPLIENQCQSTVAGVREGSAPNPIEKQLEKPKEQSLEESFQDIMGSEIENFA